MLDLIEAQKAIRGEGLDGWLFCNYAHRDSLSDSLLAVPEGHTNSRLWFALVPPEGQIQVLVHVIEPSILDHLNPSRCLYDSWETMRAKLAVWQGKHIAVLADSGQPSISTMDGGTLDLLRSAGIIPVSAAVLMQRCFSLMDSDSRVSHERTAKKLYQLTHDTWDWIADRFTAGIPTTEGEVQDYLLDGFDRSGLITDHPPIVGFGKNSADPHYMPPGKDHSGPRGALLEPEQVVQLDMWAKESGGWYADISWSGFSGAQAPANIIQTFAILCRARDLVFETLMQCLGTGLPVTGAELDAAVRNYLTAAGYKTALRHRSGHGIDTDCHGSGVNLDSVEFPDHRPILEGSCFSVEPGLYFKSWGLRTEINLYILEGRPVVSGGIPQSGLLTIS